MGFLQNPKQGTNTTSSVTVNGKTGLDITLVKSDIGLSNVTNDVQVKRSEMATANGIATLDTSSKLVQMPTKTDIGLGNVDNLQQIPLSQKGAISGVATLDASGKVPLSQLNVTGAQISVQSNQASRLAMSISTNLQIVIQNDTQRVWGLNPNVSPATAGNWVDMGSSASTVLSVNGSTGIVSITCAGIGAVPTTTTVNSKALSGNITLTLSDLITLSNTGINFLCDDGTFKTITNMTGATSSVSGASGLVPIPTAGKQGLFLKGDGTWANIMNNVVLSTSGNIGLLNNTIYDITNITVANSTLALPTGTTTGDKIKIIVSCSGFSDSTFFTISGNINGASNSVINNRPYITYEFTWSQTNLTWIIGISNSGF